MGRCSSSRIDHAATNIESSYPTAVIALAFVLAMGFLLVILSCALWNNWLPLLVGELGAGSSLHVEGRRWLM